MDRQMHALSRRHRQRGLIHFAFFFILIAAGIVIKRGFGHPEYMMLFHGPAAVFLVLSGINFTWHHRHRLALLRRRLDGALPMAADLTSSMGGE